MELSLSEYVALGEQLRDPNPNITSQRQRSLAFADYLLSHYPDDAEVIALRARHARMAHALTDALALTTRGLSLHGDHAALLRLHYNLQRQMGDHVGADQTLLMLFLNDENAGQISGYLGQTDTRRLVLGPGEHFYPGWLHLDLCPNDARYVAFDAREALFMPSGAIDTVFSEHMIEHISYDQGLFLAQEIFRVLKPGGRVRLATPDLARTCSLAADALNDTQQNYINFINESFGGDFNNRPSFVINNMFFTYNHAFVYDEVTLRELLERVGFTAVERCMPRVSQHRELNNLEMHHLLGHPWVEDFQTLVMEAQKP